MQTAFSPLRATTSFNRSLHLLQSVKPICFDRVVYLSSSPYRSMASLNISAPAIPLSKPEDALVKKHHQPNGKGFMNPWESYKPFALSQIFTWVMKTKILGLEKDPDTTPPTVTVRKPNFLPTRETPKLRATWLGHACYYVEFPGGLRVLFDPVFTDRCSPTGFFGPKRYTDVPCRVEDIPFIDLVVISHNHYDHMSYPTLLAISKLHPNAHFFTTLGNEAWFKKNGMPACTELDWWDDREIKLQPQSSSSSTPISAVISCLPCQHSTSRNGFDRDATLWASWAVRSGGANLYFGGDTGYRTVPFSNSKPNKPSSSSNSSDQASSSDNHDHAAPADPTLAAAAEHAQHQDLPHCPAFAAIGAHRGPFTLGLLPIGAYAPRGLMSGVHVAPAESAAIFAETRCRRALAMHWGTWVLTQEPVLEPPALLRRALRERGLPETGVFDVCDIGESREFEEI